MSYEIFYNRFAVNNEDGTFSIYLEQGSNNVWDTSNNRRARSWTICKEFNRVTRQDVINWLEGVLEHCVTSAMSWDKFSREEALEKVKANFDYYCSMTLYGRSKVTYKVFCNYFLKALDEAKTKTEWEALRVRFSNDTKYETLASVYGYENYLYNLKLERLIARNNKPSTKTKPESYFVIQLPNHYYFYKKIKYGLRKSLNVRSAKPFKTLKDAQRLVNKYGLDIVSIDEVANSEGRWL